MNRRNLRFILATPPFLVAAVLCALLAPAGNGVALGIALAALFVIVVTV